MVEIWNLDLLIWFVLGWMWVWVFVWVLLEEFEFVKNLVIDICVRYDGFYCYKIKFKMIIYEVGFSIDLE